MFDQHNKLTTTSYIVLGVSSLIGFIFIVIILGLNGPNQGWPHFLIAGIMCLVLFLNTYLAFKIYKRSKRALVFSLWLYGLQVLGFETENWAFAFEFGMTATASFDYEGITLNINLLAIVIFSILFFAYRSVRNE